MINAWLHVRVINFCIVLCCIYCQFHNWYHRIWSTPSVKLQTGCRTNVVERDMASSTTTTKANYHRLTWVCILNCYHQSWRSRDQCCDCCGLQSHCLWILPTYAMQWNMPLHMVLVHILPVTPAYAVHITTSDGQSISQCYWWLSRTLQLL